MANNHFHGSTGDSRWIVALAVTCTCLALVLLQAKPLALETGLLIGTASTVALLGWLVFLYLFQKGHESHRLLISLLAIWMSSCGGAWLSADRFKEQASRSVANMERDFDAYASGTLHTRESDTATTPTPGAFGQVEALVRGLLSDIARIEAEHQNALQRAGWDRLLDANRLQADSGMAESHKILDEVESSIDTTHGSLNEVLGSLRARIHALDFSERDKAGMWEQVQPQLQSVYAAVDSQTELQRGIVREMRNTIALLEHSPWQAHNGQFAFARAEDSARFGQYQKALEEQVARINKLKAESQAQLDTSLDPLKQQLR